MSLGDDFKAFIEGLIPDNIETLETTVGEIAKKLNNNYYDLDGEKSEHMYIVGSVGRGTAVKGVSDLDILFDLPSSVYKKYDAYESNGQSQLLQEVKNVLKERYPKTKMSGDGQVVVIEFTNYTVELVPGFKQSDDSFKYPDTHENGSWKTTNPLPEIEECSTMATDTNNNFIYICYLLRAWKNKVGFIFGGLLIDSLVYKFLNENESHKSIEFDGYFDMTTALFEFLKGLNKEQSYWYALGSNQKVYNCDDGKFVDKAENAYNLISSYTGTEADINSKLSEIFGSDFPQSTTIALSEFAINSRKTEQFIRDMFAVDIRYSLKIDCEVKQNGFRVDFLRNMLKKKYPLMRNCSLIFEIKSCTVPDLESCDIYWKVKNQGAEALRRNQIRGQIIKTNKTKQVENTQFIGPHYVECYIVKNNVCIARDRINVPIE